MSYVSAIDNEQLSSVTKDLGNIVSIAKGKGKAAIRYGALGALSVVTTGATMWLVGISMNIAFNG